MTRHQLTTHGSTSRRTVVARVATLVTLMMFFASAPAFAHAHLKGTSPAAGARLSAAPTQLVLTFSEAPALAVSTLRLLGPDSAQVVLGELTHDAGALTITARITGALESGRYTVLWQTAGDDGHVQHGSFQFVIAENAAGLAAVARSTPTPGESAAARADSTAPAAYSISIATTAGAFDPSSTLYVVIRWVQFAALLLLIGAVAFRWWVLPRAGVAIDEATRLELSARAATSGMRGAWLLALSTLARLAAQLATMHALPGAAPSPGMAPMLLHTAWGHGWLLEVVALVVVIAALQAARRNATSVGAWRAAATAAVALGFVPALSGHAIADRTFAPFTLLFDGAHVLAGGAWLGTLAVLLAVGLPVVSAASGNGRESLIRMVNAFSTLALTCAGVLVFTGIVAARVHVASWSAFTHTTYGRTLLVKLALVVLLVLVGAWNWRRVRPALSTDGPARLARSGRTEVSIALVVLLATAVLVALPTPFELTR